MSLPELAEASRPAPQLPPRESAGWSRIEPRTWPVEAPLPLSFSQERLWFLDRLDPGIPTYNVPTALHLSGDLDATALARALSEILRRHSVLRARFETEDGRPVQRIAAGATVPLPLVDLAGLPAETGQVESRRLATAEAMQPFDLGRGPLLRAALLRLGAREHVALLTMHHIVSDGWSMGILVREVGALYAACAQGRPSPLPGLPIQYVDYAAWQRERLRGEALERELAFWREYLSGVPPLDLPTDRPRPPVQTWRGSDLGRRLDPAAREALVRLGRAQRTTMYMTLLALVAALFHRWSGQHRFTLGSPTANRNRAQMEGLIGFFVNTLALRADCTGDPTVGELLARVRASVLGAFGHQELPFERVVEELQPARDLSRTPLFQVMFVLQNNRSESLDLPGLALRGVPTDASSAKFDLTVSFGENPAGIGGGWSFNRDLFDAATIARLAGNLSVLAGALAADPQGGAGLRLSELPLLTAAERAQALLEWNDVAEAIVEEGGTETVHGLFAAQAARTPERVALVCGEEQLSYSMLSRRALGLARRLRALGIGPEAPVGLCAARTPRLVEGMLGVLAAGGAYVPLDPGYPRERLSFMLEDSGARLLLTESRFAGALAERPEGPLPVLHLDAPAAEPVRDAAAGEGAAAGNLAYFIYTSGSTGRPKGVAVEHRSAAVLLRWARDRFAPQALANVLASTSVSFDLSVFELFAPLAWGGKVLLVENALALGPNGGEPTLINTVPSAMATLVRLGAVPASARAICLAGEALRRELVEELYRLPNVREVYNLYGPSEDTTYSTWALVERSEERPPAIGRPVAATRAHVLDAALRPVPAGVVGELFLGGAGLARGYFGRPELTAERFVPDPFAGALGARLIDSGGALGARLYRTGDLVRRRADGALEFLGRADHQVKIRGFRIEPGEIEAVLATHPGVREAVVVASPDPISAGDRRLVAYYVSTAGPAQGPQPEELRAYLFPRLPAHLVPSLLVPLAELPRTPNGKVDRKALPEPERGTTASAGPRTPLEEVVAGFWREMLKLERVGVEESFFSLGGHSLLAAQLAARVTSTFQIDLPLRALFGAPTVAGLAAAILAHERVPGKSEKIARVLLRIKGMKAAGASELSPIGT